MERSASPVTRGASSPAPISQSASAAVWPCVYCLMREPKTSDTDSLRAPGWP